MSDFTTDLLQLDSLIEGANDLTIKLMDKYEGADIDPIERFRLYYIYDNLKIIRDSIERQLAGSKYPK